MRLPTSAHVVVAVACGGLAFVVAHASGVPFPSALGLYMLGNACALLLSRVRK